MKCKNCGNEVQENWALCPFCGTKIEKKKLCANCGAELQPNWMMCPFCGQKANATPAPSTLGATLQNSATSILPNVDGFGASNGILPDDFGLDLVADDIAEAQQRQQDEANAAYQKKLNLARIACIRKNFKQAKEIYESILEDDMEDVNGYLGLVRVASQNYTIFVGEEVDDAVEMAQSIAGGSFGKTDAEFNEFLAKRRAQQAQISAVEKRRREEEMRKTVAETQQKVQKQAELEYAKQRGCQLFDEKNYADARTYLETIAVDTPDLQYKLGYCCLATESYAKAMELLVKAANSGHAQAQYQVGYMHQKALGVSRSFARAIEWYTKAAGQGNADALCSLAYCYENGSGIQENKAFAVELYTKAANQGHALAQYSLAMCYRRANGVQRDFPLALQWLEKSAEQGYAPAQYEAGSLLCGDYPNIPVDNKRAFKWFLAAAEQGLADAQRLVAAFYEGGRGVRLNKAEAIRWYKLAAAQGDKIAESAYKKLQLGK